MQHIYAVYLVQRLMISFANNLHTSRVNNEIDVSLRQELTSIEH